MGLLPSVNNMQKLEMYGKIEIVLTNHLSILSLSFSISFAFIYF